jgi:ABC-type Fe3+/spermidine/putrescine transport system ATPase subunit
VYRHPGSRFVADFMGETNFIDGTIVAHDANSVRVWTALGEFDASIGRDDAWQPGQDERCTLSIRPESWRLTRTAPAAGAGAGANVVRGTIREQLYLGEMAQYIFDAGDQRLKVYELNPRVLDLSARDSVYISADRADVIALPAR